MRRSPTIARSYGVQFISKWRIRRRRQTISNFVHRSPAQAIGRWARSARGCRRVRAKSAGPGFVRPSGGSIRRSRAVDHEAIGDRLTCVLSTTACVLAGGEVVACSRPLHIPLIHVEAESCSRRPDRNCRPGRKAKNHRPLFIATSSTRQKDRRRRA